MKRHSAGIAGRNKLIRAYKSGAKVRNLEFSLTDMACAALFEKNCWYCDSAPHQKIIGSPGPGVSADGKKHSTFTYNGIDRIDNSKGYTLDNCVTCCKRCNIGKGTMSTQEFDAWIDQILSHRKVRHG